MVKVSAEDKLNLFIYHVDATVDNLTISEIIIYDGAINLLTITYAQVPSTILARNASKTCCQKVRESLNVYLQKLKRFNADCNFSTVTAKLHEEDAI